MKNLRYIPQSSTLTLDRQTCIGCGECRQVCPHGVFEIADRKADIVDLDGCMECGACAVNCPVSAVKVTPGVGCAAYIMQTWIKSRFGNTKLAPKCC
ncbi:MAG: 4Fe-4S dicluster domain-containing protein [Deltaproteobacteria bacterium]|nr:4Fe-4S dicluster domain-containing protein [Deltaproteobacteria bacterium]